MTPLPESLIKIQGSIPVHTLTENEIKAKGLVIGRQLSRIEWYNMTAIQAATWCKDKAKELGATTSFDIDDITYFAMSYVINTNPK